VGGHHATRGGAAPGYGDVRVNGEWSFARHCGIWCMPRTCGCARPSSSYSSRVISPGLGYAPAEYADTAQPPPYDNVVAARAERVAMVRDFIAHTTPEQLAEERSNPHASWHRETILSCLHTILEDEWEHHRFAVRDLDAITPRPA
jgi:hypothetical protein